MACEQLGGLLRAAATDVAGAARAAPRPRHYGTLVRVPPDVAQERRQCDLGEVLRHLEAEHPMEAPGQAKRAREVRLLDAAAGDAPDSCADAALENTRASSLLRGPTRARSPLRRSAELC